MALGASSMTGFGGGLSSAATQARAQQLSNLTGAMQMQNALRNAHYDAHRDAYFLPEYAQAEVRREPYAQAEVRKVPGTLIEELRDGLLGWLPKL